MIAENTYVGPFLIIKKLGSRRQKVYHARQTEQNRDVVLKFISVPPGVDWNKALDKIDREVTELQKLRHPNLVKIFGAGVEDEKIFLASELVEGESLSSLLARRGKLTPDLVVEYGHQISEFLRYLHAQDLIHSKLTPEKILITPDHRVKISDLRLNRARRRRWDSTRRRELDLAAYMAPEQFSEGATDKSDFYALGVILYEMLSGKLPYQPDTMGRMTRMKKKAPVPSVATHVMNCPIWLDKIVTQMLSPDTKKRPHSARAISFAFEEIKKIASTKKAAVDQITSGFNPLTVGEDKSEAKQLLGIDDGEPREPFYQTVAFQTVSLVAVIGLAGLMAWQVLMPKSSVAILGEAEALIEKDDSQSWNQARQLLKPLIERDGEFTSEAEKLYFESRRKTLVKHAEDGLSNRLQTENVQLFGKAVRCQIDGDFQLAKEIYSELVATIDPNGNERHIYVEAQDRIEALATEEPLPTEVSLLGELIAKAKAAQTPGQLLSAHDLLARITREFAGVEGYEDIVSIAGIELQTTKVRISQLKEEDTSTQNSDEPAKAKSSRGRVGEQDDAASGG